MINKKKILQIIIVFCFWTLFTIPVLACNCLDPISFAEQIKKENIILYIEVKDSSSQIEIENRDDVKLEIISTYLNYDVLENVSQSKINYPTIVSSKYSVIENYVDDYCDCWIGTSESVAAAPAFKIGEKYILFLSPSPSQDKLSLEGSIKIVDGKTSENFGKTETGTPLEDVLSELRRVDTKVYTFEESINYVPVLLVVGMTTIAITLFFLYTYRKTRQQ